MFGMAVGPLDQGSDFTNLNLSGPDKICVSVPPNSWVQVRDITMC